MVGAIVIWILVIYLATGMVMVHLEVKEALDRRRELQRREAERRRIIQTGDLEKLREFHRRNRWRDAGGMYRRADGSLANLERLESVYGERKALAMLYSLGSLFWLEFVLQSWREDQKKNTE